jgi:hypothetical protein
MKRGKFPRGVPATKDRPGRKPGPMGLAGRTGPRGPRGARGARGDAGAAGASPPAARITGADRIELLSVVQVQIDSIHRELDTQMHHSAQLGSLLAGMESKLRELIALVRLPPDDGGSRPPSRAAFPRRVSH